MKIKKINTQEISEYWNKRGETYSKSWQSVAKRKLSRLETDLVEEVIKLKLKNSKNKKLKTLDIGIGTGRITEIVLKYNVNHYATDVSKIMIDYCLRKFNNNPKLKEVVLHDILNPLPKRWGKFDLITAVRVLSYSKEWKKELTNLYESIKKGGFLIFTFPNKYSSIFISKLRKRSIEGCETSIKELEDVLKEIGFTEWNIFGLSRLLDSFYDLCDSKFSANILFMIEKLLSLIFGKTFLVRLFYIVCKK